MRTKVLSTFIALGTMLVILTLLLVLTSKQSRAVQLRNAMTAGKGGKECMSPATECNTVHVAVPKLDLTVKGTDMVATDNTICRLAKHTGNPVLSAGTSGSWDDEDVWKPIILKEGDGYKMWYAGDDGSNPRKIGLATSTDGVQWTKSPSNPVLSPSEPWESNGIRPGTVISDSGTYKMWYSGFDGDWIGRIGYATSADGVAWTKYGANPRLDVGPSGGWEDSDVYGPSVIKEDDTYHMWYVGVDGIVARIGHAMSVDGIIWIRDLANPVLDVGPPGAWDWLDVYSPSVVKTDGVYQLWYSGGTLPNAWESGYATSTDGRNWTRQKMFIPEGPPGSFDADSADYVSVTAEGAEYEIWYSGLEGSNYTIGNAKAEICNLDQSVHLPLVLGSEKACAPYYKDDFSDPDSGWYVDDNADRSYSYIGGEFEIFVKQPSSGWSVTPGAMATDFSAEVMARRLIGNSGAYGITFGIDEEWSERYFVVIWGDQYSVQRYQNGNWYVVKSWTHSSHIKTETSWNRLRVVRNGGNIAVSVNGHLLGSLFDNNIMGYRRIGLVAWSPNNSSIKARFDNFSLSTAACGQ